MRKKVAVIGAGNVGATCAQMLALTGIADITLYDIAGGIARGKALDIRQMLAVKGIQGSVEGGDDTALLKDADIVIVTAGLARKPGMSREDLLNKNKDIITGLARTVRAEAPEARVIVVTNPLDIMTYVFYRESKFEARRVMGQAGVLDSARFKAFIAMELGVDPGVVQTMVLGGHGDTMVPVASCTTVAGIPLTELMDAPVLNSLIERTRNGGAEIVAYLTTGSAFYAPAVSAAAMAEAILKDTKTLIPVSVYPEGAYGFEGLYIGLPAVIGAAGVEKVIEIALSDDESTALKKSAEKYTAIIQTLGL